MKKRELYIEEIVFELPQKEGGKYPFSIPAVWEWGRRRIKSPVTIFVGENGSGKSTVLEAIAAAAGLNPEGGSCNFSFSTKDTHSILEEYTQLIRGAYRPKDSYFLRAESFYNVATEIDELNEPDDGLLPAYGGRSLHHQSHGESFLSLAQNRLRGSGLYLFDEPEAALSPVNQLALLRVINKLVAKDSQFFICTHSPILLCYPGAQIYELSREKGRAVCLLEDYRKSDLFRFYSSFLHNPQRVIEQLME